MSKYRVKEWNPLAFRSLQLQRALKRMRWINNGRERFASGISCGTTDPSLSLSLFLLSSFLVLFSLKFLLVHRFKSIHRVFIHSDSFPIQPPIARVYRVSLCNFQADDKKKRPRDSCFTIALYLLYLVSHFHSICQYICVADLFSSRL